MALCFFATDLHGQADRYLKLFAAVARERPAAVFLGGDLLPTGRTALETCGGLHDFLGDFLVWNLRQLREGLEAAYPRVFVILGNDDPRSAEAAVLSAARDGVWEYMHERRVKWGDYDVYGYACVPPTPFLLKDWERFDVSRHVDPGCVSPEEGHRSMPVAENEVRYATIAADLARLAGDDDLSHAILLFHSPPYQTKLNRAALDGRTVDGVTLDVHVGSVAIRRFIEARQPLLSLHGHIHESARLTGAWCERIGRTYCVAGGHDGPELALVRFDPADPAAATRALI